MTAQDNEDEKVRQLRELTRLDILDMAVSVESALDVYHRTLNPDKARWLNLMDALREEGLVILRIDEARLGAK